MKKIIAGLLLVVGVGLFTACGESTPKDVAVDFVKSAYSKENADLIDFVAIPKEKNDEATQAYVKGKLAEQNARSVEYAKNKGGLDKVEVVSEEINEDRAQVQLKVIFKDNSSDNQRFKLQKLDGKWKINL